MKYYLTTRSTIPVIAGDNHYRFDSCGTHAGMNVGVFATSDKEQQKELDAQVEAGKISSIEENVYQAYLKKNQSGSVSISHSIEGKIPHPSEEEVIAEPVETEAAPEIEHSSEEAEVTAEVKPKAKRARKSKSKKSKE
jgi:hypothetical protein